MDLNFNDRESLEITIDDQPVTLPEWLSDTLPAIQTYLECVAMRKERVLWALEVDGIRIDLAKGMEDLTSFHRIQAQTIGFEELSQHLISAGRAKVSDLLGQIEEGYLLVLINDWKVAWNLWREWEPQIREPLFSLRALLQLGNSSSTTDPSNQDTTKLAEELSLIINKVQSMFDSSEVSESHEAADTVIFSELLEYSLLPWLKKIDLQFSGISDESPGLSE